MIEHRYVRQPEPWPELLPVRPFSTGKRRWSLFVLLMLSVWTVTNAFTGPDFLGLPHWLCLVGHFVAATLIITQLIALRIIYFALAAGRVRVVKP